MTPSFRRCAIGAATSAALVLSSAAPALASSRHRALVRHKPAVVAHFTVRGIVLAVHGNQVKVLSSVAKVGKTTARNRVVTLTLSPQTKKTAKARTRPASRHAALIAARDSTAATPTGLAPGAGIVATGTVGGAGTLVTTSETTTVLPAEALVGKVSSVNSDGTFTVASHDQVDGDHAEHDDNDGVVVSPTGASVRGDPVAVGQYVVVLGETDDGDMAAAKIYTFATAPTLAAGRVSTADGASKTLTVDAQSSEHEGQDNGDQANGSNPQMSVDASNAEIIINGASPAPAAAPGSAAPTTTPPPASFPAAGDQVLVVGTAGSIPGSIAASLVFDFNQADNGSVQDNQKTQDDVGQD